ncbi:MAG: LicD family protein [Angelakisella sp.]
MSKMSLEEMRDVQLSILEDVHKFCCQNNLTYYLAFGTLLGAVRHKGYIPWDDDIDICMPRPDYELFLNTYSGDGLKVICFEHDEKYPNHFAKVSNTKTLIVEKSSMEYPLGVNIDVFPINGYNSAWQVWEQGFLKILKTIKISKLYKKRKLSKNMILILFKPLLCFFSVHSINSKIIENSKKNSYRLAKIFCAESFRPVKAGLGSEVFQGRVEMPFENGRYFVMRGYDEFLKNKYGNYMALPPQSQRVPKHNSIAYIIN